LVSIQGCTQRRASPEYLGQEFKVATQLEQTVFSSVASHDYQNPDKNRFRFPKRDRRLDVRDRRCAK